MKLFFNIILHFYSFIFKELQASQRENDSFYKEREDLSSRLLEQENKQEGGFTAIIK